MSEPRTQRLQQFVDWSAQHITGDEKGQAQIFLDRLLQAFGQPGLLEVGGTPEFRIKRGKDEEGGTSFADYVWKPKVLVEMKKRGIDLARTRQQAFEYWTRLVPNRPQYTIFWANHNRAPFRGVRFPDSIPYNAPKGRLKGHFASKFSNSKE